MPAGDGSGPAGMGSRTGRGLGYCNGYESPGFTRGVPMGGGGFGRGAGFGRGRGFGRGAGFGRGFGRGFGFAGRRFYPAYGNVQPVAQGQAQAQVQPQVQYTKENEIADLKAERRFIEEDLRAIDQRLKDLEKKTNEKK